MEASAGGRASDRGCIGRRARRIPLDGAEVFQQREVGSISHRVALAEDPGDFPRLPGDDARQDQVEAAEGVYLLPLSSFRSPVSACSRRQRECDPLVSRYHLCRRIGFYHHLQCAD
jgi:hypothetical protein